MKVKSDQAGSSFLDLILLIQSSVDRLTLNYCTKNPPDTPNIPVMNYCTKNPPDTSNIPIISLHMNPDLSALSKNKLTLERKAVLAAEIFFLIWDRNKATTN